MQKIIVQGEFVTLNKYISAERSNLHLAAKIKKDATENVAWSTLGVIPVENYPVRFVFHWFCMNEKTDPDNVAFAKKYILDGLVSSHILASDSWKHCSGGFMDLFSVDADNPRVEIEIIEVE